MIDNDGAIIISPYCSNDCVFCGSTKQVNLLELKKIEKKVSENINYYINNGITSIEISGCDPGEYNDLSKLITYMKTRGIEKILLSTNGIKLSNIDFVRELKEAGLDSVKIPIYGHNAEIHEQITKAELSFDKSVQAIRNCNEVGIEVIVGTALFESNKNYILDLYKFLLTLLNNKYLNILFHNIFVVNEENSDWYIPAKDSMQYLRELDRWGLKNNLMVQFSEIPLCVFGYISNRFKIGGAPRQGLQQPKLKIEGVLDIPSYREKKYHDMCNDCEAKSRCSGFSKLDLEKNGVGNLEPISELKLYI